MSALRKEDISRFEPTRIRRPRSRKYPATSQNSHRGLFVESTFKLGVNIFLSSLAIVYLLQLLNQHSAQTGKLEQITREVEKTEGRVNKLRDNFNQDFASGAEKKLMQKQNNLIAPNQVRVVIEPSDKSEQFIQLSRYQR